MKCTNRSGLMKQDINGLGAFLFFGFGVFVIFFTRFSRSLFYER
jgi:hypothetical protein